MTEINESILEDLRRTLGLEVDVPIPSDVILLYREIKKMKDIAGVGDVKPAELPMICAMAGYGYQCKLEDIDPDAPENNGGKLRSGDRVITVYAGVEVVGVFQKYVDQELCAVRVNKDSANYRKVLISDTKKVTDGE